MEIDNFFEFTVYTLFTLGVLVIAPYSIFESFQKGIDAWSKYGCCKKFPKEFDSFGLGNSALEVLLVGIIMILVTVWYLFIDKGGHLFYWFSETNKYFSSEPSFTINDVDIFGMFCIVFIVVLLRSQSLATPKAKRVDGLYRLAYNSLFKIVGYISLIIFIVVFFLIIRGMEKSPDILLAVVTFLGLFSIFGSLFLESRVRIYFDDKYIYLYSPWRRNRIVEWVDIIQFKYSENLNLYIFKTQIQGNIHLSPYISGLNDFFERASKEDIKNFPKLYE